jgi:hypothetical protein
VATTALVDTNPTLLDLAKSQGADGMPLKVIETLTMRRPLLQDMVWREGNMSGGHRISRRRALPSPTWKRINEGIPNSKATQDTVDESCGMLALKNAIDVDLVELNGGAPYRAKQEMAMGESLMNTLESALFYESTKTHPERIMGLAPRLDALSGIPYTGQIINSGISHSGSDQSSMWFINWSDDHVYGVVPKGTATGLQYKDMGQVMTEDEDGNEFNAYVGIWKWRCGLVVEDARYVVRLANIDTSAIAKTGKLLIQDMIDAAHQLFDRQGRCAIYCNRKIATYLHQQALDSTINSTFSIDRAGGAEVVNFLGMPIRQTDALLNTEDVVA